MKKFFTLERTLSHTLGYRVYLKVKIASTIISCLIDHSQWFTSMNREVERIRFDSWWETYLAKRWIDRPLQLSKNMKIFVSQTSIHQELSPSKKKVNNQRERMIHSKDNRHSSSLPSLSVPEESNNNLTLISKWRLFMGLETWLCTHKRLPG